MKGRIKDKAKEKLGNMFKRKKKDENAEDDDEERKDEVETLEMSRS